MVKSPRILFVYLAFHVLHICSGFPVDVRTQDGGGELWAAPVLSVAVLVAAVLVLLGCTCCRHNKGFQEFTDSASSHSLAGPGAAGAALATSAGPGPGGGAVGYVNSSAEFTMFPPAVAAAAAPGDRSSVVHFEPLPDVGAARLQAPAPSRKPASFNNVVSGGLSARDWLDDPHANFPRHQLKYLRELGRGWFGRVVEGEAQNIINSEKSSKVVVKILREDATPTDQMYFLHEVRHHRDLNHPNILRLLGRCLEKDPFLLLLEGSPGGDLKTFLMQNASTAEVLNQQGVTLKMACNIAAGLHHMHSKGFVHTDLAARNCLVTSDLTVKIGDYGTSIENFKDDYYCAGDIALPIRWCAPETLHCTETTIETKEVTPNANVWNLGVVLWEICEFGKLPYTELTDDEVIVKVLGEGTYRLPLPSYISPYRNNLYLLMKLCWAPVVQRPALDQVVRMLNHLHVNHDQYIGEESSLQTDEDFERRWESFKPNTIPKTDNHTLPRHHHQGDLPVSFIEQKAFVLPRPSGEGSDVMTLSLIAPEVSSSSPMTTSPQLSLTSSSGGDFFTPNLQLKQKSASLQDLHGSVENLCETSIDENTFVRADVAVADDNSNTVKFSESLGVVESKQNELETIISEPDFDSWLQGVETTNEEDAKFVMKISEAIRDLDNALAQEKTSSSSSEVSSHTVSHHESPAKDIVASEQNAVLDFRLGITAEIETGKRRETEVQLDSLQEESFPYKTSHHENKTTDSGTDTEDETWRKRIERGEFSEKVKEKSKSVADLMILTHIECSDGSDSEPPSLTWNFERNVNGRNSLSRQYRASAVKSTCFPIAGSEGNIHQAVLGEEFFSTLVKLHEAQKDGHKNRLTINSLSSQSSEINLTPSPTNDPLIQRSSPFSDDSASEVHSLLSSNHSHKNNFLAFNASERKSEVTGSVNSAKPIVKEVLIDSHLTEMTVTPDVNHQQNTNSCKMPTIENDLVSSSKQEPNELKSLINSFLEAERHSNYFTTNSSSCSRDSFHNSYEFEKLSHLDNIVRLKDNNSVKEDTVTMDNANNESLSSSLCKRLSDVDSSKNFTSSQGCISDSKNIDTKGNRDITVSDTSCTELLVESDPDTLKIAPSDGVNDLSSAFVSTDGIVMVQNMLNTVDRESLEATTAVCDSSYAENEESSSMDEVKLCPDERSEQDVAVLVRDNFDIDNEIQVSGHSLSAKSADEREKNVIISNNLSIPYLTNSDEDYSGSVILGASEEFTLDYFKGLNTAFKDDSTYITDDYVYSHGDSDSKLDLGTSVPFIVGTPNETAETNNDESAAQIQLLLEQNEASQPSELNDDHDLHYFMSSKRTLASNAENTSPVPFENKLNDDRNCISLSSHDSNVSTSPEAVTEVAKEMELFPHLNTWENLNDTTEVAIERGPGYCEEINLGLEQTNDKQEKSVNADVYSVHSDVLMEIYPQDTFGEFTENCIQVSRSHQLQEETPEASSRLAKCDSCEPHDASANNQDKSIFTNVQTEVPKEVICSDSNAHLDNSVPIKTVPVCEHNDDIHSMRNESEYTITDTVYGDQSKLSNVNTETLAANVDIIKGEPESLIPSLVNNKHEINNSASPNIEDHVNVCQHDHPTICSTTSENGFSKDVYNVPSLLPENGVSECINVLSNNSSVNTLHRKAEFFNIAVAGNECGTNECEKEIKECTDDKIWAGHYLVPEHENHMKEQSILSCTSQIGKLGLEDKKSELHIPSLNLISATPVDSEQTSPDTSIVANIFDSELIKTTKPVEGQKTDDDIRYEREIVDIVLDNSQKCALLNENYNLREADHDDMSTFSDPNSDLKRTLSEFILKEVIHSSLEKSCLLAAKQAILPLVEFSKTDNDKETISDNDVRLHPEEKLFHIPTSNVNNTITSQLHIDTKTEDLEINNLETYLSKNSLQTNHSTLDFLRGGVDEKIEMCLTSKQLSLLDSGEDSLSETSPNKVEKWNHQHKAHIAGDEMLHVTFDEKNYEHSRKLHDYQVRFNQDVIVELDDELGLDVVKHSTPDDERSSDSGFRDKGSLSESCEDACDEKYNLEDIEAELEETFNKGGFNYSAKGEECDEDAEHRSTALDFPDDSFSVDGNRIEIDNIDIMNHKKCDSEKLMERNTSDPDKVEKCDVPTNYVTSLEQLNTEFSPQNLNVNTWRNENESYQFSDNFVELNVPVTSDQCMSKGELNTGSLNHKDKCEKKECNERCTCTDAVREVSSETPLKVCSNSVKEDIFLENEHFPITDHAGWFLHEPNDKRFKNSSEDECNCNYDMNIVEENLSPGSSSSDSFKNDDSSGSDKYIPLSLDEEFVAAIRNELRDKLPCAQQQSHPEEIEDVEDDLQREEEHADITIHYNVYTAPLSPILEERESVSSLTATISENYPLPSSITKGKQKDEFDSDPASPVFLNDIFGESSDYCEEQEKKRFAEEIRQALANCSVSSVDTDSDQHKNSIISEDLEEDFLQPNDVSSNNENKKTIKDSVNQQDDYDDDFLVVNTETNEVTLLESPKPKSCISFVKEFEDLSEKPVSQLAGSSSIIRSSINFNTDAASDDEVFTPDSISPGGNERSSPVNEVSDIRGSFLQDHSQECDNHHNIEDQFHSSHFVKSHVSCSDLRQNKSTNHETEKVLLEPVSSSKEKTCITEGQDYEEVISRHSVEHVQRNKEMDTLSVDESIEDKSESLSEAENKTPDDNSKSESFSEALSEPISLGTHQTGVENTLKRHQCYDDLSTGFTHDGDLTSQLEEADTGDKLDVSSFCERDPESCLCLSREKSTDIESHKNSDVTEHSELLNSLKILMNQNRTGDYSEKIADSDKNEEIEEEDSESQSIDQMNEKGPVLNDTLKLYRKRKEAEAALGDERDWLSAGREASALSTKAPMPSPEEESWKQLPSMLAFSADLNSAEEKDTDFSPVPAAISDDLMSTSFSLKEEDFGDCYTPDWESGSEDTNEEDNSSSSGEFIWKTYEGLSDFPMEVIEEEEEDDEDDDDDDDDSSSSGSGAEFVPSAWNSEATPNRSALRSPDKRSEQKKNVSFKKQKYHCVYEYPREVSDSDSEGIESPSRKRWDMYQPPSVDYASYADWDLVLEGDMPEQMNQDAEAEPDVKKAASVEQFDFYKLSSVDYDFAAGAAPDDREFFISSTARPFQFNPSCTDSLVGSNVSQFFPGKDSSVTSVKSSDCTNSEILPVPSVCDSEADHTDISTCVAETSPQKSQIQGVTGSPTKLEFKDKKFPWNSSKIESKDRLAIDSPTLRHKQGTPLPVDRVARPDDRDSPPELLSPSSPLSPSGLGELRHTRDRLKLDLPPSGSPFLLDPPSGAKRRSLVEAVKGEASLLDSGEETEDSGIESSNGHRSGDVIEGSGHI